MKTSLVRKNTCLSAVAFLSLFSGGPIIAGDTLSLAEATSRAIRKHPSLKSFDADRRLAEAKIISALAPPNPELEVETEDVLGSGVYEGFDSAVYNVGINQLLELGGKRRLRGNVAEGALKTQMLRYEAAKRQIIRETAKRFVAALAAQAFETNADETLRIASETVDTVSEMQKGGRGSKLDVGQSEIGKKEAKLQKESAKRSAALARRRLAAMWGSSRTNFSRVTGSLRNPKSAVPEMDSLSSGLENHPIIDMARADVETARRELLLQEKKKTPDLNVGLGYRRDSTVDDNAVVLGFSLPLPIRNRNKGGIAEAEAGIAKSEAGVDQAKSQLELDLAESWTRLVGAHSTYQLIADEMVPAARKQYNAVAEGFRLGRMTYLQLLEARRALAATRKESISSLEKYHTARVEIETLTGNPL